MLPKGFCFRAIQEFFLQKRKKEKKMSTTEINSRFRIQQLPSRVKAHQFIDALHEFLFPIEYSRMEAESFADEREHRLRRKLVELLAPLDEVMEVSSIEVTEQFFEGLDEIYQQLLADADFFLQSDPAAQSLEEIILTYPGFSAITSYRIAHVLYRLNVPILPRVITEHAHSKTGIDIHPGAQIDFPFFIDHGTGIVIGQTTIVGKNVKIYQGVTLGALAVLKQESGIKRHPTIEENVIIYAGSCILGGATVVGNDSIIGGNVFLTESVPAFSFVYHKSEVKIRDKSEMKSIIDFVI